ncbi:MAG: LEA type 2 family protein [Polyangiaceae bacterium]|nr:LEA type 2 family protein [Polyangiaceae bacterium]
MVRARLRSLALAAALALLAVGCVKKPTMKVQHAEVKGLQIGFPPKLDVVMNVTIDVFNPNGYDVAVRAVRGEVDFMGRHRLPIDFQPGGDGVWLASDATTRLVVPVQLPVPIALDLARVAYEAGAVPYLMRGRADVTAFRSLQVEADDYSFEERGALTREQIDRSIGVTLGIGR